MKQAIRKALKKLMTTTQNVAILVVGLVATTQVAMAQTTGGLAKAQGVMETFRDELTMIIPTIAVIALLALGIGYATKFVEKDTFVRWAIGIIIAGSAAQLTALFFT